VGGCTWASAEAVSAGDDSPVDGLETLVEHSLVWYQETGGSVRYRMLATIREFAGEWLEETGERDRLRRRHAEWFAERAYQAYLRLDSEDQLGALGWYDAEMDNLRAALTWTLEGQGEPARLDLALSLVRSLGYVWYTRGLTREALSWLDQIVAMGPGGEPGLRGVLCYWLGAFATRLGRSEQAAAAYREAVELFAADEDTTRVAKTLNALGTVAVSQGDGDEARRCWNEALTLARGDDGPDARQTEAFITANLGDLAFEEGDLATARRLLERAIEMLRPRGDRWAIAIVQRYLAKVLAAQGEQPRAHALLSEALSLLRAVSERTELADTLEILATLGQRRPRPGRVRRRRRRPRRGPGHDLRPGARLRHRLVRPAQQRADMTHPPHRPAPAGLPLALAGPLEHGEQGELHPVGGADPDVAVVPRGDDRLGERLGAGGDQPTGRPGRVRDLERDPHRAGDPGPDLDPVDQLRLGRRQQLEGGPARVQDRPAAVGPVPGLGHRQAEDVAVEGDRLVVVVHRQGQAQLANRALGHLAPLVAGGWPGPACTRRRPEACPGRAAGSRRP
jgi:tetratricopeptide (TPR) repeat protein